MTDSEFLAAYDEHADAIFRHCALRVGDREKAQDLTQDTFLRAWESMKKGTDIEHMRAFLYRIANNLIIDTYRRRRDEVSLEAAMEEGFDPKDPHQDVVRACAGSEAIERLQEVEEPYRTAVVLRFVDGLEPREIAELLGVSANVASVRIHRGIKRLASLLHAKHA